jgi:hypothetical protein
LKYATKRAFVEDLTATHDALAALLDAATPARWRQAGLWGDGWNLRDLVAHLADWHRLFLGWYDAGLRDETPAMPAAGYKWNETPRLNADLYEKSRRRTPAAVRKDFEAGYARIRAIVDALTDAQVTKPGAFRWTGKYPLTTYLGANTASHYRFAIKAFARFKKLG